MRTLKILLIDDDPVLLKALESILVEDGHMPTVASGGASGIDLFQSTLQHGAPFDVVITDLAMPYVDGNMVAVAIKNQSPSTAIILLTGWEGDPTIEADVTAKVDRVLGKPIYVSKLREALKAVISPAAT
jgi:CheY-like chemotaxis protein